MSDANKAPGGTGGGGEGRTSGPARLIERRLISVCENVTREEARRSVVYIVDVECGEEPVRAQSWVGEQPEVPVVFVKLSSVTSELGPAVLGQ